jgi:hypothetical protein
MYRSTITWFRKKVPRFTNRAVMTLYLTLDWFESSRLLYKSCERNFRSSLRIFRIFSRNRPMMQSLMPIKTNFCTEEPMNWKVVNLKFRLIGRSESAQQVDLLEPELELLQYTFGKFISSIHAIIHKARRKSVSFQSIFKHYNWSTDKAPNPWPKLQKRQAARILQITRQGLCNGLTTS